MLKRIHSESLTAKDIVFKEGLNIVLGDDNGCNSVGKTTSMKLINHVFGGEMIANNKELQKEYPDLEINFELIFNNKSYFYSRTLTDKNNINVCNSDYSIIRTININQYRSMLKDYYNIRDENITFLSAAKLTTRIWNKDHQSNTLLQEHGAKKDAVNDLLKIFNEYESISEYNEKMKHYKEEEDVSKNILKRNNIPLTSINKQLRKFEEEQKIIELDLEETKIEIESNRKKPYIPTIEEIQYQESLREQIKIAKQIDHKLLQLTTNIFSDDKYTKKLMEELHTFFPNLNYKHLSEIEKFHHDISKYLSDEIDDEIKRCELELVNVNNRIKEMKDKYDSVKTSNIDSHLLDKMITLTGKSNLVDNIIAELKTINECKEKKKSLEQSIKDTKETVYRKMETTINTDLNNCCRLIYGQERSPPQFEITERGSYHYRTNNDSGTGRTFADTIMFDQIVLRKSDVPFLIHDSYMFNHIEPHTIVKILQNYDNVKQSFISIDSHAVFDPHNKALFEKNVCLKLKSNSMLFDKIWNRSD